MHIALVCRLQPEFMSSSLVHSNKWQKLCQLMNDLNNGATMTCDEANGGGVDDNDENDNKNKCKMSRRRVRHFRR